MRPEGSAVVYRPDLGFYVMEHIEDQTQALIGLQLMPLFNTIKQSSVFSVIPKEAMLKLQKVDRASRSNYNRGDWTYERGLFSTSEKGWEEPIDDNERKLFSQTNPGVADEIATMRAMNFILKGQEQRISSKLWNASTFTPHAVTNEWDDHTNATPIDDVAAGKLAFRAQCGMLPTELTITYYTFVHLKLCDQIIDKLKFTFPAIDLNKITSEQLAVIFDVPRVLVGGAMYDSADKGQPTVFTDLWNKEYASLTKSSSSPDLLVPCIGRTFLWTEESAQNAIVESYREEQTRSDIFRVRHDVDERLLQSFDNDGNVVSNIADACMYLFSNIST